MLLKILKWLGKRNIEGIVVSQYGLYQTIQNQSPNLTEAEVCKELFKRRFRRAVFKATKKENMRIDKLLNEEGYPNNVFDLCLAIATVELNAKSMEEYFYVHDIILGKLGSLGYQVEIE